MLILTCVAAKNTCIQHCAFKLFTTNNLKQHIENEVEKKKIGSSIMVPTLMFPY